MCTGLTMSSLGRTFRDGGFALGDRSIAFSFLWRWLRSREGATMTLILAAKVLYEFETAYDYRVTLPVRPSRRLVLEIPDHLGDRRKLRSHRLVHVLVESDGPRDDVGDDVGHLYQARQIAVNEHRLGDDARGSRLAAGSVLEIPAHLVHEQMALRLLQFVEDDDALVIRG